MTETAQHQVEWRLSPGLVDYSAALAAMDRRVMAIRDGQARELVWLLEHPSLYTAGTSAKPADLIVSDRFPVYETGRGGQYTYHGPGQRVGYVMLDLRRRGPDVRAFVCQLERWIIATLALFDVRGETRPGRIGVWVSLPPARGGGEAKIAALGIRVRHWITFHGIALNLAPDLEHFSGIVPCGIADHGVTSLSDLGLAVTMAELDAALRQCFEAEFGATAL